MAVDRKDGSILWRKNRPARPEAYTTPILLPASGKPRVAVISGSRWVDAYDLASGTEIWTLPGVGTGPVSSPVVSGEVLYVVAPDQAEGGWPEFAGLLEEHDKDGNGRLGRADVAGVWVAEHFGWLDADGSGEIGPDDWERIGSTMVNDSWGVHAIQLPQKGGKPEIVWNYRKNVSYIPSPVVYEGVFYMVQDGIVTALDPQTGDLLKRERLGEGSPKVYASPVAAGGKIYIATLEGKIAVLAAGRDFSVLATNDLGDEIWATPAAVDDRLYVRTRGKLYSFAAATAKTSK
jgi:outer membrane protein assembly factor BamB